MSGPTDADRAKAAETLNYGPDERVSPMDAEYVDAIAAALASERGETEALIRRAETAEAALSVARRGWDAERAAVADLRARVGAVAEELLEETTVTARLAKVYQSKERWGQAAIVAAKAWTSGNAAARIRAAVTDTTGGTR